jgi:DNA invertase Pin-like site-specific DNA recombinase
MSTSELVSPQHLQRKALIYIRQSTPHQVLSNQESLHLQYALHQRALELGWRAEDIEIIDADLGLTATSASHRVGFQELVAKVTLGQVGIILSFDVMRLSRNCSDWYPLLDVCGYRGCLIADRDGIYDPGSANGRLLLGLKGQLSELELHTIRARMTAGLLNKAQRGELALTLPIGLVRDAIGKVHKDPNREIQDRLELVFSTFLRVRSESLVLQFLNSHDLCLPRRDRFGDVIWKKPTVAAILQILKNPAYAGAFVYGKTRSMRKDPASPHTQEVRLPMDQWKIRVNDVYPAYIAWDTFEQIQQMLLDKYAAYDRNKSRGVPRDGAALLHGIVYCGECGHKMVVQYKNGTRYLCNYLRQQYHVPVCQYIHADPVDRQVVEAFFQALSPVELDVYAAAVATQQATAQQLTHAHQQHLERLRYEAQVAQRQFNRVDPDNRLVAAELEKRWEAALAELKRAEEEQTVGSVSPASLLALSAELQTAFQAIGQHLPTVWQQGRIRQQHKKALLRALIDKVVVHRLARDQMQARIVWKGGETTTLVIPVPLGTFKDLAGAETMERMILERSTAGILDEAIAQELTDLGYRSPMGLVVLPSTVKGIRLKHGIFQKRSQSHPRRIEGALTISQIATALDIDPHWIYDRIHNGTIQVDKDPITRLFLFPDSPTTLEQFRQLHSGKFQHLRFSRGHQDA